MKLPRPRPQENYREALRRAFDALAGREPEDIARECGGRARGGAVEVECLGDALEVDLGRREVRTARLGSPKSAGGDAAVPDRLAAVVARYVMLARELPAEAGPEIGFADWPDARNYTGPFRGRALGALLGAFGRDPAGFVRAAERLGAERVETGAPGAVACRLRVFPRATVTVILHPADDEFPADGQMLFPRGLFEAFAPDDVVAFGELASRALWERAQA